MRLRTAYPLVAVPVILAVAALAIGSVRITPAEILSALFVSTASSDIATVIVQEVRLPRILVALGAGGMLATAGLIMQTVFRNALAGPGVLGVGSGAGLGVAFVMLARPISEAAVPAVVAASAGALAVLGLILLVDRWMDQTVVVLVLGLLFSYAASALATVLMAGADPQGLQRFVFWSFGSFAIARGWPQFVLPIVAIVTTISLRFLSRQMDTLLLGNLYTESSGINVRRLRSFLLLLAGLLVGLCTAVCGPIAFVGVAVPHLARALLTKTRHSILIPATSLIGASLAVGADLVSRLPGSDRVLPLNAVLSLVGVPVIVLVVLRSGKGRLVT